MSDEWIDSAEVAKILRAPNRERARAWMWNHGFDGRRENKGGRPYLYKRSDAAQVRQERIDWKLDPVTTEAGQEEETRLQLRRAHHASLAEGVGRHDYVPPPSSFDSQKHAEARAKLRAQLDGTVSVRDLDYLASRAGERRRRGQTYGQTEHMLKGGKGDP